MVKSSLQTLPAWRAGLIVFITLILVFGFSQPARAESPLPEAPWPVINITSNITTNTTWTAGNVYYIRTDVTVSAGVTLTINSGTAVKFLVPINPATDPLTELKFASGANLVINAEPDNRVFFTSGRDDALGGDSNGDGSATSAAAGDWDYLVMEDWSGSMQNVTFKYSKEGLKIRNNSGSVNLTPTVSSINFDLNICGLTLTVNGSASIFGTISNNNFTANQYGLCTSWQNGNGQASPAIENNTFTGSTILPIFLNVASYPVYSGNTFVGTANVGDPQPLDHLGIGLGNIWRAGGTFAIVDGMPFVVVKPMELADNINFTFPAGMVMKFFTKSEFTATDTTLRYLKIYGNLTLNSAVDQPIIFTSYHDDTFGGDTNGDNSDTDPYGGDWDMVYFRDDSATGAPEFTFQYLSFRYAANGLLYESTLDNSTRWPVVTQSSFIGNVNGLHFKAKSDRPDSILEPNISNCSFQNNGISLTLTTQTQPGVPIYLENTVRPVYTNNAFTNNLHPAIGVAGIWRTNATWTAVSGNGLAQLPYLVHGELKYGNWPLNGPDTTATLTLPAGTVVKFFVNAVNPTSRTGRSRLLVAGNLNLLSDAANNIVFTSFYDGAFGGNTSGDAFPAARKDWIDVTLRNPSSYIHDAIFRYAEFGLHLENKTSEPLSPDIRLTRFEENENGLYLDTQGNGLITSLVDSCVFVRNTFGLTTFAKSTWNTTPRITGFSSPVLINNRFEENSQFPIYLNGSASLAGLAINNTFLNNLHRAIGLGGYHNGASDVWLPLVVGDSNAPFNSKIFPYVVYENTYFDWDTQLNIAAGLVFKFNDAKELQITGELQMATSSGVRNYFTSYRDDYYDDTNGTPSPDPLPVRGQWKGIYIANPFTPSFSYSTIKYADQGLVLFQHKNNILGDLSTSIQSNVFEQNKNGLTLWIESNYNLTPVIANSSFNNNDYGLHTYTNNSAVAHYGTSNPQLTTNSFTNHTEFPIYLQGSSNPIYAGNVFDDNLHPAIALGGYWSRQATWTLVYDETFSQNMPYVVKETLTQELTSPDSNTISVPANAIFKFMPDKYFYLWGKLNMLSSAGNEIVFTAYADDANGGNIDNVTATPARNAWKTAWFLDYPGKINDVHDFKAYYATAAIGLYYDGPINTRVQTKIRNAYMSNNLSCIVAMVGWHDTPTAGMGDLEPELSNITMADNDYGLLTIAHNKSIGIVYPKLMNVTFTNTRFYPIFEGGTTTIDFNANNIIKATESLAPLPVGDLAGEFSADSLELGDLNPVGMDELQAKLAFMAEERPVAAPGTNLATLPNVAPAIALAGTWNNSVTLTDLQGIPYVIPGGFPLTVVLSSGSYKPADDVTVGAVNPPDGTSTLTVAGGSIFKLGGSRSLIVQGSLNMLTSLSSPMIFTSIKDDSAGGDTNRDGYLSTPAKGDWTEVRISTSSGEIKYAFVRYSKNGIHLYLDGLINQNITPTVRESVFNKNQTGLTLTAKTMADVIATITGNKFFDNDIHILGMPSDVDKIGHLCVQAHQNDILGGSSQNGVENRNLNGEADLLCPAPAFNATYNYWDSPTGPTHSTNPGGLGSIVSDRVAFNPWLGTPYNPPRTYSISGQVTLDTEDGPGLPGVMIWLYGSANVSTTTGPDGFYQISGVAPGLYYLTAGLAGYSVSPIALSIGINSDAPGINFVGKVSTASGAVSINSIWGERPTSTTKKYCEFTVSLASALPAGQSAVIDYATRDGTALSTQDYYGKSGKLTFVSGGNTFQKILVEVRAGSANTKDEFFVIELKNPVNAVFVNSIGRCTLFDPIKIYLPIVRK